MTLLRLSILKHVVVAAAQSGKVKTVLQAVALTGLCLPLRQLDRAARTTSGVVLFYVSQVAARRGRRDDAVVGLRVLPRRVATARVHPRHVTFTRRPPSRWCSGPATSY